MGNQAKVFDTKEIMPVYRELIKNGKEVSLPITGHSMEPFLKEGRDRVILTDCKGAFLKRGDIALFMREDGKYIMHRVVKKEGGNYFFAGDEQTFIEGPIKHSCVVALVKEAYRKGKRITCKNFTWWFFKHIWLLILPMRRGILKFLNRTIYGSCENEEG